MLFVFDENFSKKLAEGLDLLDKANTHSKIVVDVVSAEQLMGKRGAPDTALYEKVGRSKGVLFTKDKDFKQIKAYQGVLEEHKAIVFFFKYHKDFRLIWDQVIVLVRFWEKIKDKASNPGNALVFEINSKGEIKECHL